jgi:hypothetical protein
VGRDGNGLGTLDRFLVSELGRLAGLSRMIASCYGVLLAGLVGAFVTLFRGGAVTLGRSFMVIRSSCVGLFGHEWTPFNDGVSGVNL